MKIITSQDSGIRSIEVMRHCPHAFSLKIDFNQDIPEGAIERKNLSRGYYFDGQRIEYDDKMGYASVHVGQTAWKEGVQDYRRYMEVRGVSGTQLRQAMDFVGCQDRLAERKTATKLEKRECGVIRDFLDYLCKSKLPANLLYTSFSAGSLNLTNSVLTNLFATIKDEAPYLGRLDFFLVKKPDGDYKLDTPPFAELFSKISYGSRLHIISSNLHFLKEDNISHANVWLLDSDKKTIELFEPHGSVAVWSKTILDWVETETFYPISPLYHYRVIPPMDYCPRLGPQAVNRDEFCNAWSSLYAFLRVKCPSVSSHDVVQQMMMNGDTKALQKLINNWICYVSAVMKERHVFEVASWLDANDVSTFWLSVLTAFREEGDAPKAWHMIQNH